MNIDFSGQVVVVAGGTGGLGRVVSREFLLAGARVIVTYYDEAEFRDLQELAGPNRLSLEGHAVDVTDVAGVAGFLNALVAKHGKVDSLVNTVGGYAGGMKLWGPGHKGIRSHVGSQSAVRVHPGPRGNADHAEDETCTDRQRSGEGCNRSRRRCRWVCCLQGRCGGAYGLPCGGRQGNRRAREFHSSKHH